MAKVHLGMKRYGKTGNLSTADLGITTVNLIDEWCPDNIRVKVDGEDTVFPKGYDKLFSKKEDIEPVYLFGLRYTEGSDLKDLKYNDLKYKEVKATSFAEAFELSKVVLGEHLELQIIELVGTVKY